MPAPHTLKRRSEFLAAAGSGIKFVKPSIVVQARKRGESEISGSSIRVGYTATRKLGNAVIRNRTKRRLRAAVAQLIPSFGLDGCDYVFIGREPAFKGTFDDLIRDMKHALKRLSEILKESASGCQLPAVRDSRNADSRKPKAD